LSQFKKYHPSGNLKFDNLRIFQSLKLRVLVEKILPISLKLKFTQNTLGCYGLKVKILVHTIHTSDPPVTALLRERGSLWSHRWFELPDLSNKRATFYEP